MASKLIDLEKYWERRCRDEMAENERLREDMEQAYKKAVEAANAAVPKFKLNTPEHKAWLEAFDKAFNAALMFNRWT